MTKQAKVTIVVPVYDDWPSLKECILSLKKNVNTKYHTILFVNDCGPHMQSIEQNIRTLIKGWDNARYVKNQKNLGFVGTCNKAVFEYDTSNNDILLLNSDTEVTKGFLEEMLTVLNLATSHAAVSPRSNNATIATVPLSASFKKDVSAKESHSIFTAIQQQLPEFVEVPTAHGFCMLIRRSVIQRFGLFDIAFGKGYGEEVDFCQRIALKGYKSLLANHAYVFHHEARSFSLAKKKELLQQHDRIIQKRYPNYNNLLRDYIEDALLAEQSLLAQVGIKASNEGLLKRTARRNKYVYKLIQKTKRRVRLSG